MQFLMSIYGCISLLLCILISAKSLQPLTVYGIFIKYYYTIQKAIYNRKREWKIKGLRQKKNLDSLRRTLEKENNT